MSRLPSRLLLQGMWLSALATRWMKRSPQPPQRILVAHHLLLGDTLMLAPLLAKLRQQYPQAEILMTCPRPIVGLFAGRPYGVTALPYDPSDAGTLRNLWPRRGFDLAILPADTRTSWLALGLRSRHIVGFAGDRPAYKNWPLDERRPWPARPMALHDMFATLVDGPPPPPFSPRDWPLPAPRPFSAPAGHYAVLHLGASSRLKLWPPERWASLADWLVQQGITPVWSAGGRETALVEAADPQGRHLSHAGQLDLLQLAHLVKGARLLVCPDTGVAHLGRIVGTPTLTLFGPGSALLCGAGDFWQDSAYRALSVEIACRNQQVLFKREIDWVQRCGRPFGESPRACAEARCMTGLALAAVQQAATQLLAPSGTRRR